jgi:hypothetical protein
MLKKNPPRPTLSRYVPKKAARPGVTQASPVRDIRSSQEWEALCDWCPRQRAKWLRMEQLYQCVQRLLLPGGIDAFPVPYPSHGGNTGSNPLCATR